MNTILTIRWSWDPHTCIIIMVMSYTGKTGFLYWIAPLILWGNGLWINPIDRSLVQSQRITAINHHKNCWITMPCHLPKLWHINLSFISSQYGLPIYIIHTGNSNCPLFTYVFPVFSDIDIKFVVAFIVYTTAIVFIVRDSEVLWDILTLGTLQHHNTSTI